MKKKILFITILVCFVLILVSCNRSILDTTYKFNYAYVKLPDGNVIMGEVETWMDFEDSDQLQVKINGVTYLTHATNIVLVSKEG